MREINTHKVNAVNDRLFIAVMDDPGHGNASHRYIISGFDAGKNASCGASQKTDAEILFQNGPIAEFGVNGVTNEALLAIVIDQLQCFQNGPYSCRENAMALTKLEEAKQWLFARTLERMQRGVEGKRVV